MLDIKQLESKTALPQLTTQKELTARTDVLVVVLTEEAIAQPPAFLSVLSTNTFLAEDLKKRKNASFYGGKDDLYGVCFARVVNFSSNYNIFEAAGELTRALLKEKVTSFSLYFADSIKAEQVTTFVTGVNLANYKDIRKSYIGVEESAQFKRFTSFTVISSTWNYEDKETRFAIESTQYSLFCRQLLNLRPNDAHPESLVQFCKDLAASNSKISIETVVGKELLDKGLNLIYSVGRGASKKPAMVIMKYEGNPTKSEDLIAIVGKGVCFDAGGLNIKPTGAIEAMWFDKGGSITVLSAFKAIVELGLPVNVVCSVAFVENLLGSDAYHPSDIITSYKGLTVEIKNTDAEGRLILADTMAYTQKNYKPHTLIEFSTLTGAMMIALGLTTAGVFSNSDDLVAELLESSNATTERLYRMPIFEEHKNNTVGKQADLNNASDSRYGGASIAAAFLEFFVEKGVRWAHLDIAGTVHSAEKFVYAEGSTGFGVRLILDYMRRRSVA